MTTLATAPAIASAESDTRHYTTLIAVAPSHAVVEWAASRALVTAASHPEAATSMVRAVRAAILVRMAELAVLDAAKADGYKQWFAALAAARITARPAGQVTP